MIHKQLLSVAVALALSMGVSVAQKKQAPPKGDWLQQAIAAKEQIAAASTNGLPYTSDEYRRGIKPGVVSIDLTGLKEVSLVTWGTPDGTDNDHAVWGNAKFTKKNGETVWLEDMKPKFRKIEGNWMTVNKNFAGNALQVRDTKYEHGMIAHANSIMVFDLGGEYTKFDSEIGIDEGSSGGSAMFKVMATSGRTEAEALVAACPDVETNLVPFIGAPVADWLTSPGTALERASVVRLVTQLDKPEYYTSRIDALEKEPNVEKRIREYMKLQKEVGSVLNLQNQLVWLNMEAIDLAVADMKKMSGFDAAKCDARLAELKALVAKGFGNIYSGDKAVLEAANRALALKREILVSNPALDVDKILVTRYKLGDAARYVMAPSLGTQANNWSNQYSASRGGFNAEILELTNLRGDKIHERSIYKPKGDDAVTDVHLHWDADRMLFTSTDEEKRWSIYEIGIDGKGLHRVVEIPEKDVEFTDATYLPSGKIIVNTTLGYHGVPCVDGADAVGNLALWDPANKKLRRLTFDQDNNWNPVVMNNGRVMYTRWEYTDLMHYYSRIIFHMNPDGTEQKALFGSGAMFPNSTFDIQPLPDGSSAFIGMISGHHGIARSGRLIIFDPAKARKGVEGMVQELPYRNRPIIPLVKDELVNGVWPQFMKPQPLTAKYFLVTAKLSPNSLWGVYLVDVFDNLTLICEAEGEGFVNPIPVAKRKTPPVIPDKVQEDNKEATVFIQDIYEGEGLKGVPRGSVKKIRVMAYEYAYLHTGSNHYAQGIQSGWDIKRLLGEVDVEEDGSVIFTIPANTPVGLQPLDVNGRAIQWMRSWFVGQPGETVSCVGCHEDQNLIPMPKKVIAAGKKPAKITAPEGGVRPFTFELEIQPILDRACVACHNGTDLKGGIDFTGGRKDERLGFSKSYLAFHPYFYRQGPEAEMAVLNPYEYNESNSEMFQILHAGHHGVELTDKEMKTLYNWLDFNVPYNSTFNANDLKQKDGASINQKERRKMLADKYACGSSVDWEAEIVAYAEYLKKQPKPEPVKPAAQPAPEVKKFKVKGWPFTPEQAKAMVGDDNRKSVDLGDGIKMNFVRIPAGTFVAGGTGYGQTKSKEKVKVDKSFWMGEIEVSNEQMRTMIPAHDSRYIGQFWKDHTTPGYPVNQPERSATKVSYLEAMEFCKKLSEKTGLKVNLPTEEQWEWAARAGSESDFWYGDSNTNFGAYENLADEELTKMAVAGVDPQPMSKTSFWYPYVNFIPKDESVNDGNMLMTKGGTYKPNAWGLYDMQGNVAEWTRSDFERSSDPTIVDADKVVRGGSWYERPKRAIIPIRRNFLPWQQVWNVGFRVIIEE